MVYKKWLIFSLIVSLLCLSAVFARAQDPETTYFDLYNPQAVVPRRNLQFTDPGAVVVHDGTFYMFHNGFNFWPGRVGVYLSTSADGYTWERMDNLPIFGIDDVPFGGFTALATSAVVDDDGTWVMYYYVMTEEENFPPISIGRATAPEAIGPWTADAEPVLTQGAEGTWDSFAVTQPSVIRTDDGYVMHYMGMDSETARIGMATSEDGINWTKYDDPETTEDLYAESDPVIYSMDNPELPENQQQVWQPSVQLTPDGWVMIFKNGVGQLANGSMIYLATSDDGINWTIDYDRFPIHFRDLPMGRSVWFTRLIYSEGTYFIYEEFGTVDPSIGLITSVYLSTYTGSLPISD